MILTTKVLIWPCRVEQKERKCVLWKKWMIVPPKRDRRAPVYDMSHRQLQAKINAGNMLLQYCHAC